ncbi:MAG: NAD(+)/NADH kinase [Clostridia bacterium]|nr:NAD(+)/NADH kinase [Clostridia bacterium]
MRIAIIPNVIKDTGLKITKRLISLLSGRAELYTSDASCAALGGCKLLDEGNMYSLCDIIITLGGDGTLLGVARKAALYDKPVLCINLGRLGFLAESDENYFFSEGYKRLFSGYETRERMMIKAEVHRADGVGEFHALNDIVVTRTDFACVENIDVFVDGAELGSYFADGIIVSTPTGSTGYSLSAGGPIIDPEIEAMVITPICPHMLHARPVVIPPHKEVKLVKTPRENTKCAVSVDGKNGCELWDGEFVVIKKSEYKSKLIKISDKCFYDVLRDKLS